jgi:hypothetical protein
VNAIIPHLVEELRTEADRCRNDGAQDIAELLDESAGYFCAPYELLGWTPVTEALPDDEITVLVFMPDAAEPVAFGFHSDGAWHTAGFSVLPSVVSAWATMPSGPHPINPTRS